jgi:hypothetical protein
VNSRESFGGIDGTQQQMPHIQIEDMGGNMTRNNDNVHEARKNASGHTSENNSVLGYGGKGDPSRGGHRTRTTEHTSHIGFNTTEGGAGLGIDRGTGDVMSMSFNVPHTVGQASPIQNQSENILNYPYAYDQDQKHEVDF